MAKFLLGVAIIAFTSFCGYLLAKKYRQRKQFFAQFREFNERFLTEIAYYRRPIAQFINGYAYKGEFDELLKEYFSVMEKHSQTDRAFIDLPEYSFLTQEEKGFIGDYFLMLGKGDSSSQKGYFSSVKDKIIKWQLDSAEQCKRYGDLYIKIGFLCGLLVLILII